MRFISCLLFIFIVWATNPVKAQESMLPEISYSMLLKLIDTAKVYYPKYKAYQRKVNIALLDVRKQKISWFDPLNFSFVYSPGSTTTLVSNPSFLNGYQIGLGINLGAILQKPYLIKEAKEKVEIAKLEKDGYDLNLTSEVSQRYFFYVQTVTSFKMVTKMLIEAESITKDVRARFEKTEETFEKYNQALIQLTQQKQKLIESEGAVLVAKTKLEELVGKRLEDIK